MIRRTFAAFIGLAGACVAWKSLWDIAVLFVDNWSPFHGFIHDPGPAFRASLTWFAGGFAVLYLALLMLAVPDRQPEPEHGPEGMLR